MSDAEDRQSEQIAYWNNGGGEKWVAAQEQTDRMLAPVSDALLARAGLEPGIAVLDIGCGCGATALELAKRVGPQGRVLGVDVSAAMLARAQVRLAGFSQAQLVLADAAAYPFEAFAELAVSRFGVMFFGEPALAFANIRKAIKPSGRLLFACWRALDENLWMKVPLQAVDSAGVPRLPRPGPDDPGPISFADPARVQSKLSAAGFSGISCTPADFPVDIAAGGGLEAAVQQAMTIGAASTAVRDQPVAVREQAARHIAAALVPYAAGPSVMLQGAIWFVEAKPA